MPVTVAAEEGIVGLALLAWLVAAALLGDAAGLGNGFTSRVALATGIVLLAIAVHSLFYASFFEDPMTWALLGLVGLIARVPKKPPPAQAEPPSTRAVGARAGPHDPRAPSGNALQVSKAASPEGH